MITIRKEEHKSVNLNAGRERGPYRCRKCGTLKHQHDCKAAKPVSKPKKNANRPRKVASTCKSELSPPASPVAPATHITAAKSTVMAPAAVSELEPQPTESRALQTLNARYGTLARQPPERPASAPAAAMMVGSGVPRAFAMSAVQVDFYSAFIQ